MVKDSQTPCVERSGTILNGVYQISGSFEEGAHSKVIKSYDTRRRRTVAIKHPKELNERRDSAAAMEIEILKRLNRAENTDDGSPRLIVQLHEHFEIDGLPHLVLEYLPHTLRDVLERKVLLSDRDTLVVAVVLLRALDFLSRVSNESPIVHGDLKPENIMLNKSGQLKIVDFGTSFYTEDRRYSFCQTKCYRAPEVIMHESFDGAIDVWSVACIVAECSQGKQLFSGHHDRHQIYVIAEYLGTPPLHLIQKGSRREQYFREKDGGGWEFKEAVDFGRPFVPGSKSLLPRLKSDQRQSHKNLLREILVRMLDYDPQTRLKPSEALGHSLFKNRFTAQQLKIDMKKVRQ